MKNINATASILMSSLVVLMEAFWVYPWLLFLGQWPALTWQRTPLHLISVIVLIGVAFLATRLLLDKNWPLHRLQLLVMSIGLVAIFLVVRVEYGGSLGPLNWRWFIYFARILLDGFSRLNPMMIALTATVYLWWRGISWGRSPLYFDKIYRSFKLGLFFLVLLVIAWTMVSADDTLGNLLTTIWLYIAGFFFFGLLALALGNRQFISQTALRKLADTGAASSLQWFYILFVVVGGIVLIGVGLAGAFSAEFLGLVMNYINTAADWLIDILVYALLPFGYITQGLFLIAQYLLMLYRGDKEFAPLNPANSPTGREMEELLVPRALSPEVILALKWGFFTIIVVAAAYFLARAVFRYWAPRSGGDIDETRESLLSRAVIKADILLFLSMLWEWLKGIRKKPAAAPDIPAWYTEEEIPESLDIREIYRHLLWEAANSGIKRHRHETAYEYAGRLQQAVPGGSQQLAWLTGLYVGVRYGDAKLPDNEARQANQLWKTLCRMLRALRGPGDTR